MCDKFIIINKMIEQDLSQPESLQEVPEMPKTQASTGWSANNYDDQNHGNLDFQNRGQSSQLDFERGFGTQQSFLNQRGYDMAFDESVMQSCVFPWNRELKEQETPSDSTLEKELQNNPLPKQSNGKTQIKDPQFNYILKPKAEKSLLICLFIILKPVKFEQKSGNIIRLLVDMSINYIPQYIDQYPQQIREQILQMCSQFKAWHLQKKMNVYKLEHLWKFYVDECQVVKHSSRKSRQIFNMIIRKHTLEALKRPKSQIKNKVHYMRVVKFFSQRLRNSTLSERVQSR